MKLHHKIRWNRVTKINHITCNKISLVIGSIPARSQNCLDSSEYRAIVISHLKKIKISLHIFNHNIISSWVNNVIIILKKTSNDMDSQVASADVIVTISIRIKRWFRHKWANLANHFRETKSIEIEMTEWQKHLKANE